MQWPGSWLLPFQNACVQLGDRHGDDIALKLVEMIPERLDLRDRLVGRAEHLLGFRRALDARPPRRGLALSDIALLQLVHGAEGISKTRLERGNEARALFVIAGHRANSFARAFAALPAAAFTSRHKSSISLTAAAS